MTTLADRTIDALRTLHHDLDALVAGLSDAQLEGSSGSAEWSVAQTLSHLGSGAEIMLATWRTAADGEPEPAADFNEGVWARWNAMSVREQADCFRTADALLIERLGSLTAEQRETLSVTLGFAPAPLSVAAVAGLRLNETALHSWDVGVALDPAAGVDAEAASVLVDQFRGELGFLLGFLGKRDVLSAPAVVGVEGHDVALAVGDTIALRAAAGEPTAQLSGPVEALVRLIGGRLAPEHTPTTTQVTGNVSLAELRRVFPGF